MKRAVLLLLVIAILAALILIPGWATKANAAALSDDINTFAKDNPQGFSTICWSIAAYYQRKDDLAKALEWTDRVLKISPENAPALFYKSQLQYNLSRFKDCVVTLEKLNASAELKSSPLLVSVRALLYQTYLKTGKLDSIEKDFDQKLKAKNIDADTYRQILMMYRVSQNYKKIVDISKRAIKDYSSETMFSLALAYAYEKSGKINESIKEYKGLIQRQSGNTTALALLFDLLKENKKWDEAISLWENYVKNDPENTFKSLQLADLYYFSGKKAEALAIYKACLAKIPSNSMLAQRVTDVQTELANSDKAINKK
ncbi:MAG: hypothetical protein NTY47_00115 [Candidatus Omnitrophica bacterium]|nr:hypothetical protein [Candidatus Omnitrophota bacterium]